MVSGFLLFLPFSGLEEKNIRFSWQVPGKLMQVCVVVVVVVVRSKAQSLGYRSERYRSKIKG
jgi:hypothetical protein